MMTISANYEGRYSDLRQFISSLDRSDRFLIIEDITAAPQPEPGKAEKPGPMLVDAPKLKSFLGLTSVSYVERHSPLAIVDTTLANG